MACLPDSTATREPIYKACTGANQDLAQTDVAQTWHACCQSPGENDSARRKQKNQNPESSGAPNLRRVTLQNFTCATPAGNRQLLPCRPQAIAPATTIGAQDG